MNVKCWFVAILQFVFLVPSALGQSLPNVWVDNNELTCGINSSCYSGSPGLSLTPPAYELVLGANSWTSGPPPSYCTFSTSSPIYPATAAGKQNAINAIEACRTAGIAHGAAIGIILDVPPGMYLLPGGVVIPQTSSTLATAPLIIRSTMDSTLASMPEPVCAGGVQDNLAQSTHIGLINSDCQAGAGGGTFGYQLGNTVTAIPPGPFTLKNGTPENTSNYNYLQYMYQDQCSSGSCLQLCSPNLNPPNQCVSAIGPDHWEFEDGAVSLTTGNKTDNEIVKTGVTGGATNTSQFVTHIHFRRYWAHGDWTSLTAGSNSTSSAFNLAGCAYCSVVGSQVSQVLRPGAEGHAIGGTGFQYKIDNDWFEGASSGIFGGGFSSPPQITGPPSQVPYVPFQDVQIGRVRNTFPYSWLGVMNADCGTHGSLTIPSANPYWGCTTSKGVSIVRKNCEEFKEGERVLIYGFICENVDNSGGQRGVVAGIGVRNTSGGGPVPQNYQATINDVTIQNAIFRNACEGLSLDGRSASASGDGGGVSYPLNKLALSNVLEYNISSSNFAAGACPSGIQVGMKMGNGGGGQRWQGTIACNSVAGTCTFQGLASVEAGETVNGSSGASGGNTTYTVANSTAAANDLLCGSPSGNHVFVSGFSNLANNNTTTGFQCVSSTATTVVLANPSGVAESIPTPRTNNANPVVSSTAALGFQVMDIYVGDPVGVGNCTTSGLNLITQNWGGGFYWPTQVQTHVTAAPAAWSGTFNPAGLSVTYSWTAAQGNTGQSDNTGTCLLTNGEGGPENVTINHLTFITDASETIGSGASNSNGVQFSLKHTLENSILLSGSGTTCGPTNCAGWYNQQQSEGNPTEVFDYDASTMTAAFLVWPGRANNLLYDEYPNNPSVPDPDCSSSTGNWNPTAGGSNPPVGGCNPPNSMYFPATAYCPGSSPTYSGPGTGCVGFKGAMNLPTGPMPLTLTDYHGFGLVSISTGSSYFHNRASDGTDLGVIVPSLDTAQTTSLYSCAPSSCGSPGPFPD